METPAGSRLSRTIAWQPTGQRYLPLIAQYVLNASPASFGLLTSSMAIGSVGSALFMAGRGKVSRQRIFAYLIRATPLRLVLQLRSRER